MNVKSLMLKPTITSDVHGEILDTSADTISMYNEDAVGYAVHSVLASEEGRLDKIALRYYGRVDYMDLIMVFNGLANPFDVSFGDVLFIPGYSQDLYKSEKKIEDKKLSDSNASIIRRQYTDMKNMNKPSKNKLESINNLKRSMNSPTEETLPPNMLQPGTENVRSNANGTLTLGTAL